MAVLIALGLIEIAGDEAGEHLREKAVAQIFGVKNHAADRGLLPWRLWQPEIRYRLIAVPLSPVYQVGLAKHRWFPLGIKLLKFLDQPVIVDLHLSRCHLVQLGAFGAEVRLAHASPLGAEHRPAIGVVEEQVSGLWMTLQESVERFRTPRARRGKLVPHLVHHLVSPLAHVLVRDGKDLIKVPLDRSFHLAVPLDGSKVSHAEDNQSGG